MQTINAPNQCNQSMQTIDPEKNIHLCSTKNQCNQSMLTINATNQCNECIPAKKNTHHVFDQKTPIIPKLMRNNIFRPRKHPKSENPSDIPCSTRNHPRTEIISENPFFNQKTPKI